MPDHSRSREQTPLAVFQQELPVRLVNVSRSGCLLRVPRPVRVGTIGRLRLALDDMEYADDVRVARCRHVQGTSCELGVELLWVPRLAVPAAKAWPGRGTAAVTHRVDGCADHAADVSAAHRTVEERHMENVIARLVREEEGQDLIEYALIATFVSLVAAVGAGLLGTALDQWYGAVAGKVDAMKGKVGA